MTSLSVKYISPDPDAKIDALVEKLVREHGGTWIGSGYYFAGQTRDIQFDVPATQMQFCIDELEKHGFRAEAAA